MSRICSLTALAVLACGIPLAQTRADDGGACCDPCCKPGLLQRLFAKKECCDPCCKPEPCCKPCKVECCKPCKVECCKPCKPVCCDPCDPCCKPSLLDRLRDHFRKCDACCDPCPAPKCDPCCDPCARKLSLRLFKKDCCCAGAVVEHKEEKPAEKK